MSTHSFIVLSYAVPALALIVFAAVVFIGGLMAAAFRIGQRWSGEADCVDYRGAWLATCTAAAALLLATAFGAIAVVIHNWN